VRIPAVKSQEFRFLLVGASNTLWGVLSYPIYFALLTPLGLNYVVILVITYVLNGIISFTAQKYLVFRTQGNHLKEFWKYALFQGAILAVNLVILPLLVVKFGLDPVIAQTIFLLFVIAVTYFFHKFVTFRHKTHITSD
jgi:putative flippase GtrA